MSGWSGWALALSAWGMALLVLRPAAHPYRGRRPRTARRRFGGGLQPQRWARPAAVVGGAALAVTSHPLVGLLAGACLWWFLPAVVARLETSEDSARRVALAEQLPMAAGLLSACLAAGSPIADALATAARAMPEPAGGLLDGAARIAALGGGPLELAAVLSEAGEPGWRNLGAAVVRSAATGAPLADLLHAQADTALQSWAAAALVRARSAGVKSVLPLALCFLPAFLLLGVAPLVAGLLSGVSLP